jgi:hypothetical protein
LRGREIDLFNSMLELLSNSIREFSVKSLCWLLNSSLRINNNISFNGLWKGLVPPKVEVFCWLAILNRLNTRGMLSKRGIIDV